MTKLSTKKLPIKRTITGGVVGATIGYLATPENGKKLLTRIKDTEWKDKGRQIGKATKGKVVDLKEAGMQKSKETIQKVKDANVFTNSHENQEEETELVNEDSFIELKEENKRLQERLKGLEEKINNLTVTEEDETDTKEQANKNNKTTKKTTSTKRKSTSNKKANTSVTNNDDTKSESGE